ncbi:metal transporter [Salinigranum rubrum]|uniref:Metal transporter n=1 Tax=Salinigranum rubrum TaxID=755307 RepID=A0A2I8VHJ3_9EURY|nr:PDGLE domain-containing protein [Salinigranum rubrum]AUV81380.1 metal transporter [Salinigranum rubrum]
MNGRWTDTPTWFRRSLVVLVVLVVLAPVFALAAGAVGYAEPLENVAEATGATEHERTLLSSPFPDYSVPGTGTVVGTLVSGLLGTAITLAVAVGAGRLLGRDLGL